MAHFLKYYIERSTQGLQVWNCKADRVVEIVNTAGVGGDSGAKKSSDENDSQTSLLASLNSLTTVVIVSPNLL
jgi:hypothetical protein